MKLRWTAALLITGVLAGMACAQNASAAEPGTRMLVSLPKQESSSLSRTPDLTVEQLRAPQGPQDPYGERMEVVLQAMTAELGEIAQAAREGKISREQAQYLSLERYYVALSRFQLLRTLYQKPPEEVQPAEGSDGNTAPQISGATVIIPPRASAAEVPQQVIAYLQLNPAQVLAIQAQISDERQRVQPLLARLDESRRKLVAIELSGNGNSDQVQSLAAEQSRIVEKLIIANASLESKLYRLLTPEQRRKADELLKQRLSSVQAQFPEW